MTDTIDSEGQGTIGKAVSSARGAANEALDTAGGAAKEATRRTAEMIEENPLGVIVGGVALGVLAGTLLPRTQQEASLLKPVGDRVHGLTSGAIKQAKNAGKDQLDAFGLTRDSAKDSGRKLIENVLKTLAVAGAAALTSGRGDKPAAASPTAPD